MFHDLAPQSLMCSQSDRGKDVTSCAVQGKALLNPGRTGFHTTENRVRMPLTARGHAVLGTDFTVQGWSLCIFCLSNQPASLRIRSIPYTLLSATPRWLACTETSTLARVNDGRDDKQTCTQVCTQVCKTWRQPDHTTVQHTVHARRAESLTSRVCMVHGVSACCRQTGTLHARDKTCQKVCQHCLYLCFGACAQPTFTFMHRSCVPFSCLVKLPPGLPHMTATHLSACHPCHHAAL